MFVKRKFLIKFAIHNYVAISIRRSCNEMVRNCGITCNSQFYQNLSKPSKCIFSEAHPLAPFWNCVHYYEIIGEFDERL